MSLEKTVWSTDRIIFLGLLIDLRTGTVCIPQEKVMVATSSIERMVKKGKTTLRELQQLCGYLNFLCKAVIPGRVFTRRLYSIVENSERKPHHHIDLTREHKLDLKLWLEFLESQHLYNTKFFDFENTVKFETKFFCTDASRNENLGCGGIWEKEWFVMQWDEDFITRFNPSINYLELYALCVGIFSWLHNFQNCNIVI